MEDFKYYRELYVSEVTDHILRLNELFLHLERDPNDRDALIEAFRIMHSIKGDSAMMGLNEIVSLAHEAEDLLANIKDGKCPIDRPTIDRLLSYVDRIEKSIDAITCGGSSYTMSRSTTITDDSPTSTAAVPLGPRTPSNEADKTSTSPQSNDVVDIGVPAREAMQRRGTFRIIINNCFEEGLKHIRSFTLLKTLAENGNLLSVEPAYEELASGNVPSKLVCTISTPDLGKLKDDLMKIPGVTSLDIESMESEGTSPQSGIEEGKNLEGSSGVDSSISALDKLTQIDQLISCVETKVEEAKTANVEALKDRHRLGEIKVNVQSLDKLFNLAGELVLAKSRLNNIVKTIDSPDLKELQRFIEGVVTDLQNEVMSIRLMPIGQIFGVFSRMVRDMAKSSGKDIDLVIEGGDTAIDRKVLEEIMDPIIHILRNSVDHGIEPPEERVRMGKNAVGTIRIKAYRDATNFVLDIEDDGRGMDPKAIKATALAKGLINTKKADSMSDEEALYLVCIPGFSTKRNPSTTSGRGMGMSTVKSKVEALGGTLLIKSSTGLGTRVSMRLPASMATIKVLVVRVGENCFAIPLSDVVEIIKVKDDQIRYIHGESFIDLRGKIMRIYALSELLGLRESSELHTAVIVRRIDGREYGLLVSEVVDEDEVAVKPVPEIFHGMRSLLGASVLGDGRPTFIIDVMTLV